MENTKDKMSNENIDNQDRGKVPQREKRGQGFQLEHWHIIALGLMLYDSLALSFSYLIALWLRYDLRYSTIDTIYIERWKAFLPFYILGSLAVFWFLKLYKSIWRFASYSELLRVSMATVICSVFHIIGITLLWGRMPISYYVIGAILQYLAVLGIRFSYRFILLLRKVNNKKSHHRIMVIGAGAAGQMLIRDIQRSGEVDGAVVCIIDDNKNKWGRLIDNIPVVGGRESILEAVEKFAVDKIFLAIPSATVSQRRDILQICNETTCELKNLPGMYQLVTGQVSASAMRKVSVEDLLGRDPIKVDLREVFSFINGKTVLVTGGGGSIGSELCRQIAGHSPKKLIIFDIYENNAYNIQLELRENFPELDLLVLIGSVRDSRRMFQIFKEYRPEIVYHAAAHKHVPLMEDSPCESIKNNALGTYKTAYAAMVNGCKRFVLISTDKAVNPANIMGASKRLCEMIIQAFDSKIKAGRVQDIPQLFTHKGMENADKDGTGAVFQDIQTEFVAVRFGNVLGSNGSVIPIFKKQIEKGGPVTVTHPDIIRYFMTIPEAVSLVLEAGTFAKGGEIFVLDMGSPVKIDTLARNLIRLSGFKPDIDIKVQYSGLRPGEKLYEEKLMAEEGLQNTANERIHIGKPLSFDIDAFLGKVDELMEAAYKNKDDIREMVKDIVGTYKPAE
ncbi:FlaA1/EpsC-like NDP-sugar epimerase [Oribacterium sinus]|uniref:FlaA1/EpsC-like NDP-sugar epimerase n=1 Tax=Oribacterium sinus TaxID=237576 RepID=A0A7W9SFH8_9FIRM|nr:nucleoside-diphosphate sugar epimerase/dehydratase [Oribacterium sinus]MBB6040530.1 FlaA1/EpsC-like NDP-sugar epimerase [Oribacterium sinus]